mmetsp:Transcript_6770/g.16329  ORF Transcript_6770/g.16329 Transcript_6770/m.16329 type:complete len:547 (-) Transcript_6770:65-1705(-)
MAALSGGPMHEDEIYRIHELWTHTKNELKSKARELSELERTRAMELEQLQSEHTHGMKEMQSIALELRDKCRVLETQLTGAREESRRQAEQVQESQRRVREAQLQAEQQSSGSRQSETRIRELQETVRALQRERKEVIDKSYADFRRQEDGIVQRELAIGQLEGRLRTVQQELHGARDEKQLEGDRLREQARRFEDADHANRELGRQLSAAREQLKFLQISRRNESQLHAIVDQLQADNARLVIILAATEEFKEFVDYADDSAGLSYIAPSASSGIGAKLRHDAQTGRADRPVRGSAAETEGWVPSDAYTLANEFRHEHTPGLSTEVFADLLLRLNGVWRQREQRRVARLRKRFHDERVRLGRRHNNGLPYELVTQEAEIERLKRELRAVRIGVGGGRRRLNETEEKLFESSLAAVESLSAQLAAYRHKEQMTRDDGGGDGARFADGAASASRMAAEMVDVLSDKVGLLVRDFQHKTVELPKDDPDIFIKLVRVQGWFLENLERRINTARERIRSLAFELQAEVADDADYDEAAHSGYEYDDGDGF